MGGIILEPFTCNHADLAKCVEWLNDPEVVKYSEQRHKKHDTNSQEEYITAHPYYYGIYVPHLIGTISAQIDKANKVAQVGIMIGDKSMWRKSYGFESWRTFCDALFSMNKMRKIEAGCMATNYGMISIFLKYNMIFEAYIPGHFLVDGEEVAEVRYGKFNEAV